MHEKDSTSSLAWLGLAGYVFGYDVYALLNKKETLSEGFNRAMHHPRKRWLVILAWGFTTKHLFFRDRIKWLDPFGIIGLFVDSVKRIFCKGENAC